MLALQLLINGLITGSALGIVAISFSLVFSTAKIFHVAHAGVYTMAGYLAWSLLRYDKKFNLIFFFTKKIGIFLARQSISRIAKSNEEGRPECRVVDYTADVPDMSVNGRFTIWIGIGGLLAITIILNTFHSTKFNICVLNNHQRTIPIVKLAVSLVA